MILIAHVIGALGKDVGERSKTLLTRCLSGLGVVIDAGDMLQMSIGMIMRMDIPRMITIDRIRSSDL